MTDYDAIIAVSIGLFAIGALIFAVRMVWRWRARHHARVFVDLASEIFATPDIPPKAKDTVYRMTQRLDDVSVLAAVINDLRTNKRNPGRRTEGTKVFAAVPKKHRGLVAEAVHNYAMSLSYQDFTLGFRYSLLIAERSREAMTNQNNASKKATTKHTIHQRVEVPEVLTVTASINEPSLAHG